MTASTNFRSLWLVLLTMASALSACGTVGRLQADSFKPYTPEVVQGNFVSREQRQALQPGMTRAQARNILGTPLVSSLFHADRWDYAFSIRRQGIAAQQFRLTLHFKGDALERIEGDELPSESEFAERLVRSSGSVKAPPLQATDEQLARYRVERQQPAAPTVLNIPLPASYPPLESAPR